ncbi:MAG: hypothetical protein E7168_03895 [Firmicutes bacterium]|nr:hypothetical protein [Bacillota bacterium]
MTMSLIDEINDNGTLDPNTTAEYRAKAPAILTMLQNEIIGIENRYKAFNEQIKPIPIETLDQPVQLDDIKANTLLTNGLASHLMLYEDTAVASFFQQRYEEMRNKYLKPVPITITKKIDKYDSSLSY